MDVLGIFVIYRYYVFVFVLRIYIYIYVVGGNSQENATTGSTSPAAQCVHRCAQFNLLCCWFCPARSKTEYRYDDYDTSKVSCTGILFFPFGNGMFPSNQKQPNHTEWHLGRWLEVHASSILLEREREQSTKFKRVCKYRVVFGAYSSIDRTVHPYTNHTYIHTYTHWRTSCFPSTPTLFSITKQHFLQQIPHHDTNNDDDDDG